MPKSRAETLRRNSPVVRAGVILIMLSLLAPITTLHAGAVANCPAVVVCFTPGEKCTESIVKGLGEAKTSILVQACSFTSAPIAKALLYAHKRGLRVEVILDKSQRTEQYSSADFLANQGVPTKIDAAHAISYNKIIVIDGETIITGSFNFTKAAQEKNAENLLVIRDKALAA